MMSETEVNARIGALAAQRNEALDRVVILAGMLAMKDARIKELEAQLPKPVPELKEVKSD